MKILKSFWLHVLAVFLDKNYLHKALTFCFISNYSESMFLTLHHIWNNSKHSKTTERSKFMLSFFL